MQPATASAYACELVELLDGNGAHGRGVYDASGRGRTASAPDGDDPRAPRPARRLDDDLVALGPAEHRPADRRVGRDAADARDLDRHALAVVALELDARADADDAARRGGLLVDHLGRAQPLAENRDAALEQALLVLRRVVLEVLRQVAVPARDRDRLDDRLAPRPLELGELGRELLALGERQLLAPLGRTVPSGRSRRSRRSSRRRRRRPKLGTLAAPCTAKVENWRETFVAEQSGQAISCSPRTSSSKCDSHSMQTYS